MLSIGQIVTVCSFKHDGSVHRVWDSNQVVAIQEDCLVLGNFRTGVIESDGRRWQTKEPALSFFFPKRWYNVIAMFRTDGVHFYCNLASPHLVEQSMISYIDYDLDVGLAPSGIVRVLDENEYAHNAEKFHYSTSLKTVIEQTMLQVMADVRNKAFPFSEAFVQPFFKDYFRMKKI